MTKPSWLAGLLAETQDTRPSPRTGHNRATAPGQIWRALAMDRNEPSVLVLIIDTDTTSRHLSVVLLTPDLELAGNRDYLLLGEVTGTGYDLAAQTELASDIWEAQADTYLGEVTPEQLADIIEMVNDGDATPNPELVVGPPVVEQSDPRWNFKRTELVRLQRLAHECVRQLIDGEPHLLPDPSALRVSDSFEENLHLESYVLTLLDLVAENRIELPVWLIDHMYSDTHTVNLLRTNGLYDVARALLGKAVLRLGDDDPQLAPVKPQETSQNEFERMRRMLLAQTRTTGKTCVTFVTREADLDEYPPISRVYVNKQMMQCVTTDDRTLVSRTH